MNKKECLKLTGILNEIIINKGASFGPSLIGMYLFGPFGIKHSISDKLINLPFSKEAIKILRDKSQIIDLEYSNFVLPKFYKLANILTGGQMRNFKDKGSEFINNFEIEPFEKIRKIVREKYRKRLSFAIDAPTLEGLMSNDEMKYRNDFVNFYYDRKHEFLFKFRLKKGKSAINKYLDRFKELSKEDKNNFGNFIIDVSNDSNEFWKNETLESYYDIYGKDLVEIMLGDYCGFSIIDLNQERANKRMDIIAKNFKKFKYPGFKIVKKRFDNHRDRIKNSRPGGLHLTLIDQTLKNFPTEILYSGLCSLTLDMFGAYAHPLYALRGKKKNRNL